jgi:hypothetical protein
MFRKKHTTGILFYYTFTYTFTFTCAFTYTLHIHIYKSFYLFKDFLPTYRFGPVGKGKQTTFYLRPNPYCPLSPTGAKHAGGNPYCPRPTPEWQKGIGTFLVQSPKGKNSATESESDAAAEGGSVEGGSQESSASSDCG